MWKQIAKLKTVRGYGESYFMARKRIDLARMQGTFKDVLVAYGAFLNLECKAKRETGLTLKMCAGFVIPDRFEGQCV